MLGKRIKLFRVLGIPLQIDLSWFIVLFLVMWSLAAGWFPHLYEELSKTSYWIMGLCGAMGLFISIVFHELGHAMIAIKHGVRMRSITLFIFGGVAEMENEPPHAKAEFFVAVAGPIVSVVIAAAAYGFGWIGQAAGWPTPIVGVIGYLAAINAILVIFNLVPAFPLDGGRVLRSALWAWKKDLRWATRITSEIGSGFGIVLIILGVISFLGGNFVGGIWWFILGLFLRGAASMSYQQLILRRALEGEPVRRFMHADPVNVPPSTTVRDLVENYLYKYHYKLFPVTDNGNLQGCVAIKQIKNIPREHWADHVVCEIMEPCSSETTIDANADAMQALSRMSRTQQSRMMVVDQGQLVGIISLKDMLKFLSLKIELEEEDSTLNINVPG